MTVAFPGLNEEPTGSRPQPVRRVRQEVRDGVAVIAFSAGASTALAVTFLLITVLAGRAA
jgi:hypothetical protein